MENPSLVYPPGSRIDYDAILSDFLDRKTEDLASFLTEELPYAWLDAYLASMPRPTNIVQFHFDTFVYVYDDYASLETTGAVPYRADTKARLVAVYGHSAPKKTKRDDGRLKGWVGPTEETFGDSWDKGHFIAHSLGGSVDQAEVNVFVQRRDLNRGRSAAGKRYVQMEKYCKVHPRTFCFSRPLYLDQTAKPSFLEFGILVNGPRLWVECFDNR